MQTPAERRIWQRCFWAGLATLILGAVVISLFPSEGGNYPMGYGELVIAFEFSQSASDVKNAIGFGDTGWQERAAAMKTGTYADVLFIFAFTVFMVSFFHAAKVQTGLALYKFLAAVALIAGLADVTEDFLALRILSDIEISSGTAWMHYFVKTKFMALGLVGLGAGIFLLRQPRILRKLEGAFAFGGGAAVLFALTRPEHMGDLLGLGVTVSWIAMLAYAATQAFKKVTP